jgi:hypothetical protein
MIWQEGWVFLSCIARILGGRAMLGTLTGVLYALCLVL